MDLGLDTLSSEPTMNEIIPNLWLGDLISALDAKTLRARGVRSVVSVMRGRVRVCETFVRRQVPIDDMEEEDILIHMGPCIHFIRKELEKGHGVLVHCQAGVSRSATIVTAYLMHMPSTSSTSTAGAPLTPTRALALVRAKRPIVNPNPGFMKQLELFYYAGCPSASAPIPTLAPNHRSDSLPTLSAGDSVLIQQYKDVLMKSRSVRAWYLKRQAYWMRRGDADYVTASEGDGVDEGEGKELMWMVYPSAYQDPESGDGGGQGAEVDSRYVSMSGPSGSVPIARGLDAHRTQPPVNTSHPQARRDPPTEPRPCKKRILRCKMCRYVVAGMEDMLEHGTQAPLARVGEGVVLDPKCSGYIIEPPPWHIPSHSSLSGKLPCPNPRGCTAKLGNFDWAGVKCGCGGWAVPGFVLGRGKVDDILVSVGK